MSDQIRPITSSLLRYTRHEIFCLSSFLTHCHVFLPFSIHYLNRSHNYRQYSLCFTHVSTLDVHVQHFKRGAMQHLQASTPLKALHHVIQWMNFNVFNSLSQFSPNVSFKSSVNCCISFPSPQTWVYSASWFNLNSLKCRARSEYIVCTSVKGASPIWIVIRSINPGTNGTTMFCAT